SLERHIFRGWNIFHSESGDYLISLPAQGRVSDHWYEGTADAIFQNIHAVQVENPDAVLVLSGDHIYKSDYRKILRYHQEKNADAVVLTKIVPVAEASRFGILGVDNENQIVSFTEKPRKPAPTPWDPSKSLVSMGVYLFDTRVLIKALLKDARNPKSSHDFGRDIIPRLVKESNIYAYLFDGYWEDIGTIDAYWKANMAFLSSNPPIIMKDPSWPIRTYKPQYPPTFVRGGTIHNSIISPGCSIENCEIRNSIISEGVKVGFGAQVEDSILLEGAEVREGARLRRIIVDKGAVMAENSEVGFDEMRDGRYFKISKEGIRIVPKDWNPA
ncbi:MAG: sugar phosphate nucleotidyltransferase, partial [Acidobacteriota bacterium]|nr:sugar phosphate nucleotidyltransferase [Acidobacteriota bacterium]